MASRIRGSGSTRFTVLDGTSTLRALAYHRVDNDATARTDLAPFITATPDVFERQLRHITRYYHPVSAEELLAAVTQGTQLPPRAVLVTFDDGYRDFYDVAWPILKEHGVPAVLFIPTAFADEPERVFWWDALWQMLTRTRQDVITLAGATFVLPTSESGRTAAFWSLVSWIKRLSPHARRSALQQLGEQLQVTPEPTHAVLSWSELRRLATDGVTVAAHGQSHELLDQLSPPALAREVEGCRDDLVREMGYCPPLFAYPNGNHNNAAVAALRAAGFRLGFTVAHGINHLDRADPLRLRRDQGDVSPFRFAVHFAGPMAELRARRHPLPARAAGPERPTRVATLLSFPPSYPGGISTFVGSLLPALARFAPEMHLVAPKRFRAGPGQRGSQMLLAIEQFLALLRTQPDIVHNHEHPALLAAAVAYRAVARLSVRVIHTVHIHPVERKSLIKRLLVGWLFSRCWSVTTVSQHTARSLANIAQPVPAAVRVVYGASEIPVRALDDPSVREFLAAHGVKGGPILCQVGPMNFPLKVAGIVRLIEAFDLLRREFPEAQLLIVGDGRFRTTVDEACSRLHLSDAVHITGFVSDVSPALAAADIYCHISFQDACPISLLEAMRSGKAIVASRTGGIPELVSHGTDGILIDGDSHQLAETLVSLLRHPAESQRLGECAAATARARFTWDRVAAEFAAIYGIEGADPAKKSLNK